MRKLPEVEEARAIMTQGADWGVWKWLMEKKRVRTIADIATDALNAAEVKVKQGWPEELKQAYDVVVDEEFSDGKKKKGNSGSAKGIDAKWLKIAREVREADVIAEECRLDAEDLFAEAEKKMSTEGARQGARKALERYDLHEAAIKKAEAAGKGK